VSGVLKKFVAQILAASSALSADQLDLFRIKQQASGAAIDVGAGGLAQAKIANIYNSAIASDGNVGEIAIRGDAIGSTLTGNMNAGSDDVYGTIDDFVIDHAVAGDIAAVKLTGNLG